ncbi:hypothetical protein ACF0H5_001133 [Mactra antiquata]
MNIFSTILALLFSVAEVCRSHSEFRNFIPNGYSVPNPCTANATDICSYVGHLNDTHLNKFGEDFRVVMEKPGMTLGRVWRTLCMLDSDGDKIKNGDELGDSRCQWRYGMANPSKPRDDRFRLSHPGIPENFNRRVSIANYSKYCLNNFFN